MSTIEIVEETQTIPVSELLEDDGSLFEALLAQLRERPTLWTHLFPLMFYRDLFLALTMFLLLHLWI